MPLNAEFLADDPAASPVSTGPAVYGKRPAQILGASMLIALALVTALRWTGGTPATLETVVQQPIPADATTSSPPSISPLPTRETLPHENCPRAHFPLR